jgi:uncharacterized caspase-like protein
MLLTWRQSVATPAPLRAAVVDTRLGPSTDEVDFMAGRRLALIIASSDYEDGSLRQLAAPLEDAQALSRVLADPTLGGFQVQQSQDQPSHLVKQQIEEFFLGRDRDDLLLLYFSGHGIKDEGGRLYFATRDTRRHLLRSTAVAAPFVNDVMGQRFAATGPDPRLLLQRSVCSRHGREV